MLTQHFVFLDDSEQRWLDILENHADEAESLANRLVREGAPTAEGCIVTDTATVKKVRFKGEQYAAYRFIFCTMNQEVASYHDVITGCALTPSTYRKGPGRIISVMTGITGPTG